MPAKTIIDEREFLDLLVKGILTVAVARYCGVSPAVITEKIREFRRTEFKKKQTEWTLPPKSKEEKQIISEEILQCHLK